MQKYKSYNNMTNLEIDKAYRSFLKEISGLKKKLAEQPCCENFGDKEVRNLKDKYSGLLTGNYTIVGRFQTALAGFENWCGSYDG